MEDLSTSNKAVATLFDKYSAIRRVSAKTRSIGFLDLTHEIRTRIYKEVLFDHDRELVLLPRRLPRKVDSSGHRIGGPDEIDVSQDLCTTAEYSAGALAEANLSHQDDNECSWCDGQQHAAAASYQAYILELIQDPETDTEESDRAQLGTTEERNDEQDELMSNSGSVSNESALSETDFCANCGYLHCQSEDAGSADDDDSIVEATLDLQESPEGEESESEFREWRDQDRWIIAPRRGEVDEHGYLIPPTACIEGTCVDTCCDFCAGCGLGAEETQYCDSSDVNELIKELSAAEAYEHFDSKEQIGILFHTQEPAILLTCTEVRDECLPLYFAHNAFSWRFHYLEARRSINRFTQWTAVIGKHAKHISSLSFESRHQVEEGVEFEADIDLLTESPYFDVNVPCDTDENVDVTISGDLDRDLTAVLLIMSNRDGGAITFLAEDICMLGKTFMHAMKRYTLPSCPVHWWQSLTASQGPGNAQLISAAILMDLLVLDKPASALC